MQEIESPQPLTEDDRLNKWLVRLEDCLKNLPAETPLKQLPQQIRDAIAKDKEECPLWCNDEATSRLIRPVERLKFELRKLCIPTVLQVTQDFCQRNESETSQIAALLLNSLAFSLRCEESVALQYFADNTLNANANATTESSPASATSADAFIQLSRMLDLNIRMSRAIQRDVTSIRTLEERESDRQIKCTEALAIKEKTMQDLKDGKGRDFVESMRGSLKVKQDQLALANEEERKAKEAYDRAVRARQEAEALVYQASSKAERSKVELDQCSEVVSRRCEVEKYNATSANRRIDLAQNLSKFAAHICERVVPELFRETLPTNLFQHLLRIEQHSLTLVQQLKRFNKHVCAEAFMGLNVLKELLDMLARIWRGGIPDQAASVMRRICSSIDSNIGLIASEYTAELFSTTHKPVYEDRTVVLYYDHLIHDTPANHVESQPRFDSSLWKLREQQVQKEEVTKRNLRRLVFENCNDVSSPPLPLLALVHSPDYISKLLQYSKEATIYDLLIPLEFDTEWESGDSEDEDIELPTRCFSFDQFRVEMDAQDERIRSHVFKLKEGDRLSGSGSSENAPAVTRSYPNRTTSTNILPRKSMPRVDISHPKTPRKRTPQPMIVKTKYGIGRVLQTRFGDEISHVKLEWGAEGFFHQSQLAILEDARRGRPDPYLHRLIHNLAVQVGMRKRISDAAGLNRATFSLWINHRGSPGLNKTVETKLLAWLSQYSPHDIKMQKIPLGQPNKSGTPKSENTNANADSDVDTNPHPTPRGSKANSKYSYTYSQAAKETQAPPSSYTPPSNNRGVRYKSDVVVPPHPSSSEEQRDLRRIMLTVLQKLKMSQLRLTDELHKTFGVYVSQGSMSGYKSFSVSYEFDVRISKAVAHWLLAKSHVLPEEDQERLEELVVWADNRDAELEGDSPVSNANPNLDSDLDPTSNLDTNARDLPSCNRSPCSDPDPDPNPNLNLNPYVYFGKPPGIESRMEEELVKKEIPYFPHLPLQIQSETQLHILPKIEASERSEKQTYSDPNSIRILQNGAFNELRRRQIQHSKAAEEAGIGTGASGAAILSRFFNSKLPEGKAQFESWYERRQHTVHCLSKWLVWSMQQPGTSEPLPKGTNCHVCGRSSLTFSTKKGFNSHVYKCVSNLQPKEETELEVVKRRKRDKRRESRKFDSDVRRTKRKRIRPIDTEFVTHYDDYFEPLESSDEEYDCAEVVHESDHSLEASGLDEHSVEDEVSEDTQLTRTLPQTKDADSECLSQPQIPDRKRKHVQLTVITKEEHTDNPNPNPRIQLDSSHSLHCDANPFPNSISYSISNPIPIPIPIPKSNPTPKSNLSSYSHPNSFSNPSPYSNPNPSGYSYTHNPHPTLAANPYFEPYPKFDPNVGSYPQSIHKSELWTTHSEKCEACGLNEADTMLHCNGCPLSFHPHCANLVDVDPTSWFCDTCRTFGVDLSEEVDEGTRDASLVGHWLLLYSKTQKRWRLVYAMGYDHSRQLVLIKWWRPDGKGGKNVLLDPAHGNLRKVKVDEKIFRDRTVEKLRSARTQTSIHAQKPIHTHTHTHIHTQVKEAFDEGSEPSSPVMHDTYLSATSLKAAMCGAGIVCRAVDVVMHSKRTNVFACVRPPGHHAGRNGCTPGCTSTGFCLLNNPAFAVYYARTRYQVQRCAVVDIDVHFGNGTADILRNDPKAFFASVHMIWGPDNQLRGGFYPYGLGITEVTDTYVSVGVGPNSDEARAAERSAGHGTPISEDELHALVGPKGFRRAISDVIIPKMMEFDPELLIISAGFDGYVSDPLGSDLGLGLHDYRWATRALCEAANDCSAKGRVISVLEGGYDVAEETLGLAECVNVHVRTMRETREEHLHTHTHTNAHTHTHTHASERTHTHEQHQDQNSSQSSANPFARACRRTRNAEAYNECEQATKDDVSSELTVSDDQPADEAATHQSSDLETVSEYGEQFSHTHTHMEIVDESD